MAEKMGDGLRIGQLPDALPVELLHEALAAAVGVGVADDASPVMTHQNDPLPERASSNGPDRNVRVRGKKPADEGKHRVLPFLRLKILRAADDGVGVHARVFLGDIQNSAVLTDQRDTGVAGADIKDQICVLHVIFHQIR